MKWINLVFAVCIFACMSFLNRSTIDDCSMLHSGTFEYMADKDKVKVVIDGESHTEYHKAGKYIIQSKLVWVSDCEYNATIVKATIPNFPFAVGQGMNVKVDKIDGKIIYYTGTINGNSWKAELKKVK